MLSEHESSNSVGEDESDWVDEICEGQEKSCDRSWSSATSPTSHSAARNQAYAPHVVTSGADESVAVAAASAKSRGTSSSKSDSTRLGTSTSLKAKKYATGGAPAALGGYRRPTIRDSGLSRRNRRSEQQTHEFRCKGFTFQWGGGAPADIPAYDLSPSLKLLRLSLDARVDEAPADVLRGFFRAFEAAGEAARSDLAAGASLTFRADKGQAAVTPLAAAAAAASGAAPEGGQGGNSQKSKQKQHALAASYFAPLGDELYVGRSPQRLQLLPPNRFIGTISVTKAPAAAAAESQIPSAKAATTEDDDSAGGDSPSHSLTNWENESSFTTWHPIRVIGASVSTVTPVSGGASAAGATPTAKEEAVASCAAAEDVQQERKSKKKKTKIRQKDEERACGDDANT